ncbi:MAG: Na+/H+ antiporter [Acidobacteria bacterium]|nr:MAG: Na+/H+ antiporter [Acidobacteriota bacterium]
MQPNSWISEVELVFLLLLLFVVVFAWLAKKLGTPYPIVLVIAGLLLGFIPGIPKVTLDPDLIFLVVLPPLLYAAAWVTPWREFKFNFVSIFMLAFGLVGFTVLGVAEISRWVFAGFDLRLGFVLGAVVATTDAIAATSIAKRIGLPQRIVDILEAESLVNDATGLLALDFALAMVVEGRTPTVGEGLLRITYLTVAGLVLGLLVGRIAEWLEHRIDDGPIEIVLSVLIPYAAYLAAETIHASGVLAVVACGMYMSQKSAHFFSPNVRIQILAVWDSITFVLNSLVFMLIGLQLPFVLAGIREYSLSQLLRYGALFSAAVILLRLIWMFPGARIANLIRRKLLHQDVPVPSVRQIFVVGWTGMRGVVALAAAISLPEKLADGSDFPHRNLTIFLTFSVILVTLVLQGLTLPPLIRLLGLAGLTGRSKEEEDARRAMIEAALERLRAEQERDGQEFQEVYDEIEERYRHRLAALAEHDSESEELAHLARYKQLLQELIRIERHTAVSLRNEGRLNDEVLRQIEHELDLSEIRLSLIA